MTAADDLADRITRVLRRTVGPIDESARGLYTIPQVARRIAEPIQEARQRRQDGQNPARRWLLEDLSRARNIHLLRHLWRKTGGETERAQQCLTAIEHELGARFPATEIPHRFVGTSSSVWDKERNRWWCHHCQHWLTGDGVTPLAAKPCPTCNNLVVT